MTAISEAPPPLKRRYRVLIGKHTTQVPMTDPRTGKERRDSTTGALLTRTIYYGRGCPLGDVFESETDYTGPQYNPPGMPRKFALDQPDLQSPDDIDAQIARLQSLKQQMLGQGQQQFTPQGHAVPPAQAPQQDTLPPPPPPLKPATPQGLAEARSVYQKMTEEELRTKCDQFEIDHSKIRGKNDLIKALLPDK